MIERPSFVTPEEFEEAKRKVKARKTRRKPDGNGGGCAEPGPDIDDAGMYQVDPPQPAEPFIPPNLGEGRPKKSPRKAKTTGNSEAPSEDYLALTFAGRHGDELRYVSLGEVAQMDRRKLGTEKTLAAFDLARKICREINSDSKGTNQ
jgi:hypothetical protein